MLLSYRNFTFAGKLTGTHFKISSMKTILTKLVFFTIVLFCISSCHKEFEEVDYGFPKNVYFPKEGGVQTVTGDTWFTHAQINAVGGIGELGTEVNGQDTLEYHIFEWLKIEYPYPQRDELTIYADPNTTGKSRKKSIIISFGRTYSTVKVKQEK